MPCLDAQDHDPNTSARKILLVGHVFVGGQEETEALFFRRTEKIPIRQFVPAFFCCSANCMPNEKGSKRHRRCLVEKNAHLCGAPGLFVEAAGGVLDHCSYLLAIEPIEPLH